MPRSKKTSGPIKKKSTPTELLIGRMGNQDEWRKSWIGHLLTADEIGVLISHYGDRLIKANHTSDVRKYQQRVKFLMSGIK